MENVLESDVTYKQKLVFLAHKFEQQVIATSEEISCDFIGKLSHGRLRIPTFDTVFFVYSAQHVYNKLDERKKGCTSYFRKLISNVDAPFATNVNACKTLSNIVFKGRVVAVSDRGNTLGCFAFRKILYQFVTILGQFKGHFSRKWHHKMIQHLIFLIFFTSLSVFSP